MCMYTRTLMCCVIYVASPPPPNRHPLRGFKKRVGHPLAGRNVYIHTSAVHPGCGGPLWALYGPPPPPSYYVWVICIMQYMLSPPPLPPPPLPPAAVLGFQTPSPHPHPRHDHPCFFSLCTCSSTCGGYLRVVMAVQTTPNAWMRR